MELPPGRNIVRCPRATEIPATIAVLRRCHGPGCDTEIWVGPTFRRPVDDGRAEALCPACFLLVETEAEVDMRIAPEQEATLQRLGALGELRRLTHLVNNKKLTLNEAFPDD